MTHVGKARTALKRGALMAAANWQVVAIQSAADMTFKLLLAVPIVGGVVLATALLGHDISELLAGDLRQILFGVTGTLAARPVALAAYLAGFLLVLVGGSLLLLLVKGGTVSVLVLADRRAGPVERPPLRMTAFRRAMWFSTEAFTSGASGLFRRFLALGILLTVAYAVAATACGLLGYGLYLLGGAGPLLVGSVAALTIVLFIAVITVVNVLYLLAQIVTAMRGTGASRTVRDVARFVRGDFWKVTRVFGVTILLLVVAMLLSLAATWGFYLIAYVPLAGLIVLPLQLIAALLRTLVFQYLGLTALSAYLSLYRTYSDDRREQPAAPILR